MADRVEMRTQDPNVRKNNFSEVALGYNKEEALLEASRCLQCKGKPCVSGCPVNIDIPRFILHLRSNDINEAAKTINEASLFGRICGRVCPQEHQCEAKCIRGIKGKSIAIGNLERYVCDNASIEAPLPKKIMVKKLQLSGRVQADLLVHMI